jgi:hypothetical protein
MLYIYKIEDQQLVTFINCNMRKILFSILLLFFCCRVFAQNITANERTSTITDKKLSTQSLKPAIGLKMNVFAPILGYSQFALERNAGHLRSVELGLGVIGAGRDLNIEPHVPWFFEPVGGYRYRAGRKNQFGGFIELGYKFIKRIHSNEISATNYNETNTIAGSYIKPSFIIGAFGFNEFSDYSSTATIRIHQRFGALMLNLGHQWVFADQVVLELYFGGGAEIDNADGNYALYGHPFVLAVAKDNPSVNFACTAGFRVGFLLNKPHD